MPTADNYADLLFHESSDDNGVAAALDAVNGPPASVVVAAGVSPIPIPSTIVTCRTAQPFPIPATDPQWPATTVRDQTVRTGPCVDGTIR